MDDTLEVSDMLYSFIKCIKEGVVCGFGVAPVNYYDPSAALSSPNCEWLLDIEAAFIHSNRLLPIKSTEMFTFNLRISPQNNSVKLHHKLFSLRMSVTGVNEQNAYGYLFTPSWHVVQYDTIASIIALIEDKMGICIYDHDHGNMFT